MDAPSSSPPTVFCAQILGCAAHVAAIDHGIQGVAGEGGDLAVTGFLDLVALGVVLAGGAQATLGAALGDAGELVAGVVGVAMYGRMRA